MIFKRKREASGFAATVSKLEEAVAARDGDRTGQAFTAVMDAVQSASDAERILAGPRLAALLPAFPPTGPRPTLAMAAGFCVERGADPMACAEPISAAYAGTCSTPWSSPVVGPLPAGARTNCPSRTRR